MEPLEGAKCLLTKAYIGGLNNPCLQFVYQKVWDISSGLTKS